jgi:uncharacterized membrane protein
MEHSPFEIILAVIALVFVGLTQLARRYPDIEWLRHFKMPELPAAQRERHRKRSERLAGIEMILVGVLLPLGYLLLTVMTFSSISPLWLTGVIAASALCIGFGIYALVKNR